MREVAGVAAEHDVVGVGEKPTAASAMSLVLVLASSLPHSRAVAESSGRSTTPASARESRA
jgi:uncharacterized protein with GYD domain